MQKTLFEIHNISYHQCIGTIYSDKDLTFQVNPELGPNQAQNLFRIEMKKNHFTNASNIMTAIRSLPTGTLSN